MTDLVYMYTGPSPIGNLENRNTGSHWLFHFPLYITVHKFPTVNIY